MRLRLCVKTHKEVVSEAKRSVVTMRKQPLMAATSSWSPFPYFFIFSGYTPPMNGQGMIAA
jgi:hypothetical protein